MNKNNKYIFAVVNYFLISIILHFILIFALSDRINYYNLIYITPPSSIIVAALAIAIVYKFLLLNSIIVKIILFFDYLFIFFIIIFFITVNFKFI